MADHTPTDQQGQVGGKAWQKKVRSERENQLLVAVGSGSV
jgi:hypothetical protein